MSDVKFPLGRVVITANALGTLSAFDVQRGLSRHCAGDWGDVCTEDWAENERSLKEDFRLLSVYMSQGHKKFWIITEADRSATTVLMPEDY